LAQSTQPNPLKTEKSRPNPNPTRPSPTQPIGQPNPWTWTALTSGMGRGAKASRTSYNIAYNLQNQEISQCQKVVIIWRKYGECKWMLNQCLERLVSK